MALKDTIRAAVTDALKAKDKVKLTALRGALAAIESAEKAGKTPRELSDNDVIAVLRKQIKLRAELAWQYRAQGNRQRALLELAEAKHIKAFLPKSITKAELEVIVSTVFAAFDGTPTKRDQGALIKQVNALVAGRADGKAVAGAVGVKLN